MAANKFATMLQRNTNRITVIIVYAVLEWILIFFLLLNSQFCSLIVKFAEFFGLKPPCLWCAKGYNNNNMCGDLVCEVHAKDISKLGYCSNHQKLVGSQGMCEDCLSSRPELHGSSARCLLKRVNEIGKVNVDENCEVVSLNCSCCGLSLNYGNNNMYSSYILLNTSSLDVYEKIITKLGDYDDVSEKLCDNDNKVLDFAAKLYDDEKVLENKNENHILAEIDKSCMRVTKTETKENGSSISLSVSNMKKIEDEKIDLVLEMEENKESFKKDLEYFLDYSGHRLVPFELMDTLTEESETKDNFEIENEVQLRDQDFSLDSVVKVEEERELVIGSRVVELDELIDINEETKISVMDSIEIEEDDNSLVFHAKDGHFVDKKFEIFSVFPETDFPCNDANDAQELVEAAREKQTDFHTACEEVAPMENDENEADVSIGTEIPDLEVADEVQNQEYVHSFEDPWTSSAHVYEAVHRDPLMCQKLHKPPGVYETFGQTSPNFTTSGPTEGLQSVSVHHRNNRQYLQLELNNEVEEDKIPDTPTSLDSLHLKLLLLDKTDSYGTESVKSELDGSDGVVTVEHLKSALRTERKALQVLYTELEEERNASAVAASQTMAMINRLQEEKAAMQMEALQYQRMMEEQSEYDQEAVQLLNELMVKREREKQELEKELEIYRKKLFDYETKEKIRALKRNMDGSAFSDTDGLSIDLNQEAKELENRYYSHQEYTPVDAIFNLEESIADFKDERLFILEQLKNLEEKLMISEENGKHLDENSHCNSDLNGFSKQMKRIAGQKGKLLLPLFDAISDENGDIMLNGNGVDSSCESSFETENKKLDVEEEVDHIYERLQALEADREFLKHCIGSLKKGDKGMDLLQEILQHLRDLRNVDLRRTNSSDDIDTPM